MGQNEVVFPKSTTTFHYQHPLHQTTSSIFILTTITTTSSTSSSSSSSSSSFSSFFSFSSFSSFSSFFFSSSSSFFSFSSSSSSSSSFSPGGVVVRTSRDRQDLIGSGSGSPHGVHLHQSVRLRAGAEVHWGRLSYGEGTLCHGQVGVVVVGRMGWLEWWKWWVEWGGWSGD